MLLCVSLENEEHLPNEHTRHSFGYSPKIKRPIIGQTSHICVDMSRCGAIMLEAASLVEELCQTLHSYAGKSSPLTLGECARPIANHVRYLQMQGRKNMNWDALSPNYSTLKVFVGGERGWGVGGSVVSFDFSRPEVRN